MSGFLHVSASYVGSIWDQIRLPHGCVGAILGAKDQTKQARYIARPLERQDEFLFGLLMFSPFCYVCWLPPKKKSFSKWKQELNPASYLVAAPPRPASALRRTRRRESHLVQQAQGFIALLSSICSIPSCNGAQAVEIGVPPMMIFFGMGAMHGPAPPKPATWRGSFEHGLDSLHFALLLFCAFSDTLYTM